MQVGDSSGFWGRRIILSALFLTTPGHLRGEPAASRKNLGDAFAQQVAHGNMLPAAWKRRNSSSGKIAGNQTVAQESVDRGVIRGDQSLSRNSSRHILYLVQDKAGIHDRGWVFQILINLGDLYNATVHIPGGAYGGKTLLAPEHSKQIRADWAHYFDITKHNGNPFNDLLPPSVACTKHHGKSLLGIGPIFDSGAQCVSIGRRVYVYSDQIRIHNDYIKGDKLSSGRDVVAAADAILRKREERCRVSESNARFRNTFRSRTRNGTNYTDSKSSMNLQNDTSSNSRYYTDYNSSMNLLNDTSITSEWNQTLDSNISTGVIHIRRCDRLRETRKAECTDPENIIAAVSSRPEVTDWLIFWYAEREYRIRLEERFNKDLPHKSFTFEEQLDFTVADKNDQLDNYFISQVLDEISSRGVSISCGIRKAKPAKLAIRERVSISDQWLESPDILPERIGPTLASLSESVCR